MTEPTPPLPPSFFDAYTPDQIARFSDLIAAARAAGEVFDIGLRLNPEHSEAEVAKYDPCQTGSRLGFPV